METPQADDEIAADSPGNIFSSEAMFADAEIAALRVERDRLKAALASRTEAWRVALRDLSQAQATLAELRGEVAVVAHDVFSHQDWENITGEANQSD